MRSLITVIVLTVIIQLFSFPKSKINYQYFKPGKKKIEHIYLDKKLEYIEEYNFDKNGNVIKEKRAHSDKSFSGYYTYSHYKNNAIEKRYYYSDEDRLLKYRMYTDRGNLKEYIDYGKNGQKLIHFKWDYQIEKESVIVKKLNLLKNKTYVSELWFKAGTLIKEKFVNPFTDKTEIHSFSLTIDDPECSLFIVKDESGNVLGERRRYLVGEGYDYKYSDVMEKRYKNSNGKYTRKILYTLYKDFDEKIQFGSFNEEINNYKISSSLTKFGRVENKDITRYNSNGKYEYSYQTNDNGAEIIKKYYDRNQNIIKEQKLSEDNIILDSKEWVYSENNLMTEYKEQNNLSDKFNWYRYLYNNQNEIYRKIRLDKDGIPLSGFEYSGSPKLVAAHKESLVLYNKENTTIKTVIENLMGNGIDDIVDNKPEDLSTKKYTHILNDYAFFLSKSKKLEDLSYSNYILERVLEEDPNRAIAYKNLADGYVKRKGFLYIKEIVKQLKKYKRMTKKELNPLFEFILAKGENLKIEDLILYCSNNNKIHQISMYEKNIDIDNDGSLEEISIYTQGTMHVTTLDIDGDVPNGYGKGKDYNYEWKDYWCYELSIIPFNNKYYILNFDREGSTIELSHLELYDKVGLKVYCEFGKIKSKQRNKNTLKKNEDLIESFESNKFKKIKFIPFNDAVKATSADSLALQIEKYLDDKVWLPPVGTPSNNISIARIDIDRDGKLEVLSKTSISSTAGRCWDGYFVLFLDNKYKTPLDESRNLGITKSGADGRFKSLYQFNGEYYLEFMDSSPQRHSLLKITNNGVEPIVEYSFKQKNIFKNYGRETGN